MSWLNKRTYKLLQNKIKDLFYLPRADRKVLFGFSLSVTIITVCSLLYLSGRHKNEARLLTEAERQQYQALCLKADNSGRRSNPIRRNRPTYGKHPRYYAVAEQTKASFPFDPNTADSTQLLALGFAPWQVRNIYKYRAKGGRFHRKEDLRKIYGMTGELLDHLLPLVRIAPKYRYLETSQADSAFKRFPTYRSNKFTQKTLVDLNTADTALLKRIPGIGDGFAIMIVRRREQLGGYISVEQLREIEHLPDSLRSWFVVKQTDGLRKININTATLKELKRHPYLNFYQCRVILEHRRKYGPLKSLNDLSLYEEFSAKDMDRLAPYFRFE